MLVQLTSAYVAVLGAEVVGDKTLYTVGSLAAHHRISAVVAGASAAMAVKMTAAVYFGQFLARLPPFVLALASMVTFAGLAVSVWLKRQRVPAVPPPGRHASWRSSSLAFAAIFCTEWADPGQMAAALLSARYRAPAVVLLGATLAAVSKVLVAATAGVSMRRWVSDTALRFFTTIVCTTMCVLAALQVEL
ncbi:MAG TPA: TMEM165/GDT1 family protein [Kofleriaceae bacterium]